MKTNYIKNDSKVLKNEIAIMINIDKPANINNK